MDKITYTLKQGGASCGEQSCYSREDLELIATYQLRDICWRERIINGIQAPLDKDVLIARFCGFGEERIICFIKKYDEEGMERLTELLQTARIHILPQSQGLCKNHLLFGDRLSQERTGLRSAISRKS